YQRLLDDHGDDLMPLDPQDPQHCVQVRRLCHIHLAALPPAGLKVYRSRVDDQVKKRLDQATGTRDIALLRRIVAEHFCSRHTDRALDLLGDLAFERGDFAEAERVWRMLAPPPSRARGQDAKPGIDVTDLRLVFPDPQVDVALVQ